VAIAALAESKRLVSKTLSLKEKSKLIKQLGGLKVGKLPLRELSEMFDLSISTVHYHLSKE
jgi:DNA-binding transcriptional ArsR family regulator